MANSFSISLLTTLLPFILLITRVKSDAFSFNFPRFESDTKTILSDGDANTTGGVLQLTKKDLYGIPSKNSFGQTTFFGAVHLSDNRTGKVADFTTEFSFVVNPKGSEPHGDGFTFYIAGLDFDFPEDPKEGGFLGLFDPKNAFNTSANQVVAVEFDSFTNVWDPSYPSNSPHVGIDINSIRSVATAPWPIDLVPQGEIGKALISYRSASKVLSVFVVYPNSPVKIETFVAYEVDLGAVLSDWVLVGFTAATGSVSETHDILSWAFNSFL
ncbi:lectin 8-like [Lotus japonicus]|uniref:lectin 8-like n=1 Tax=Lotus japonicus TaxID=34305 RepID=UPI00258C42F1|nr:lectin 8-like [Lotus japonicus]